MANSLLRTDKEIAEIDISGWVLYKSIAVIVVDEVLRGSIAPDDIVSILLDNVFRPDIWVHDTEVTSSMEVGMRGIFMPMQYDETSKYSHVEHKGETFYWLDIAQYRFPDGTRFAFLEAQDGLIFAQWAFESIANATTLDEIKQYINIMLERCNVFGNNAYIALIIYEATKKSREVF